jgi:hypothetical protein
MGKFTPKRKHHWKDAMNMDIISIGVNYNTLPYMPEYYLI